METTDNTRGGLLMEPPPLHGTPDPARFLGRERAVHRLAAYLYMTGMSQKDIASRLDVNPGTISNWVRQPWFQEFVKNEMAVSGRDSVQDIIRGAAADSVFTLVMLRDDDATPASVRMGCCKEILDRAYGKAPQTVHNVSYAGDLNDVMRIDNELRALMSDKALMQSSQANLS